MQLSEVEGVVGRLYLTVLELQRQNKQMSDILVQVAEGGANNPSPEEE